MARSYKKLLPDAGLVLDHYGPESTKPARTLFCRGQAVSRTTYARLFAVIGTTHGVGDGSTTFNLPDLRGRTSICKDTIETYKGNILNTAWADSDGGIGGEEKHTPTTAETAVHGHSYTRYQGGSSYLEGNPGGATASSTTGNAGSGNAFNVVQPGAICIKVITY